jgi:pyruvate kinase
MHRRRFTKIIATLGPASDTQRRIETLFRRGADVFRLNASHADHTVLKRMIEDIRTVERRQGRPIGILFDLQGPKLRIGEFTDGEVTLKAGDRFRLDRARTMGSAERITLPHPEVYAALKPKQEVLLDDGRVRLRVDKVGRDYAETRVTTGGRLSDHKGVNVPNTLLGLKALTTKDRKDLHFALAYGVDWIGLSFVQRARDVAEAREIVKGRAGIIAKLEKPSAIDSLDGILALSDAVMVARGDLGVELPPENVPTLQKLIIRKSREAGKPVVVATQMLESMIQAPQPTRAEASDVATAVYEGADAVMLSAETAVGAHGPKAVAMMDRIIRRVERDPHFHRLMEFNRIRSTPTDADAITAAAREVAHTINAAAIVTYTSSGSTTLRASRQRPAVPIVCLTAHRETARRLAIAWGVHAVQSADVRSFSDMVSRAARTAHREGFARPGQKVVITAGVPFGTPGSTNVLRIYEVHEERSDSGKRGR